MTPDKQYKYDIGDGRVVSRQRVSQLNNPEKLKEHQRKYREAHKEKLSEYNKYWREEFKRVHGMSYYKWKKQHDR